MSLEGLNVVTNSLVKQFGKILSVEIQFRQDKTNDFWKEAMEDKTNYLIDLKVYYRFNIPLVQATLKSDFGFGLV